jgi:hypothetical protein
MKMINYFLFKADAATGEGLVRDCAGDGHWPSMAKISSPNKTLQPYNNRKELFCLISICFYLEIV